MDPSKLGQASIPSAEEEALLKSNLAGTVLLRDLAFAEFRFLILLVFLQQPLFVPHKLAVASQEETRHDSVTNSDRFFLACLTAAFFDRVTAVPVLPCFWWASLRRQSMGPARACLEAVATNLLSIIIFTFADDEAALMRGYAFIVLYFLVCD